MGKIQQSDDSRRGWGKTRKKSKSLKITKKYPKPIY